MGSDHRIAGAAVTAAALLALSDNELAIYLNGGYGAEKRRQAVAIVRDALKKATK